MPDAPREVSSHLTVAESRRFPYFRVGNALLTLKIPGYAKMVYVTLCRHADAGGECYPSVKTLSLEAGCSPRSVTRALVALQEVGALSLRSGQDNGSTNTYVLCEIPEAQGGYAPRAQGVRPRGVPGTPEGRTEGRLMEGRLIEGQAEAGQRDLIQTFQEKFLFKYKVPPVISRPKDPVLLGKLRSQYGTLMVLTRLDQFFASDDKFIVASGHSIGTFYACFNKLIALSRDREPQPGYGKWG